MSALAGGDERLLRTPGWRRLLRRPELGSIVGAIAVFVFFALVADSFLKPASLATMLYAASTIGIMAVPVALLMIGGDFDLSAGVMVTTSALVSTMFSFQLTANTWVGVGVSLVVTLAIGFFNGYLRQRTKLPSFIITLGTFLMLTGLNLGLTKAISGGVSTKSISDMEGFSSAHALFASTLTLGGVDFKVTILWWFGLVALGTWILLRTRAGNWIFAVGGDDNAARAVGVPVTRTRIGLYLGVSFAAWISGQHLLFSF
ncbi:ABC transporter permease, partial [Streptomyces sp. NEAU-H3]